MKWTSENIEKQVNEALATINEAPHLTKYIIRQFPAFIADKIRKRLNNE